MAISLVQQEIGVSTVAVCLVDLLPPALGNRIILVAAKSTTTGLVSVAQTGVNWSLIGTIDAPGSTARLEVWEGDVVSGSAGITITITAPADDNQAAIAIEYSGALAGGTPATSTGTNSPLVSNSRTAGLGDLVVVGAVTDYDDVVLSAPTNGFAIDAQQSSHAPLGLSTMAQTSTSRCRTPTMGA